MDEPFKAFLAQGMVLKDGAKMSKSKGNVVSPDEMTAALRSGRSAPVPALRRSGGARSGLERLRDRRRPAVYPPLVAVGGGPGRRPPGHKALFGFRRMDVQAAGAPEAEILRRKEHATVVKVAGDIADRFQFNTAIAAVMELVNTLYQTKDALRTTEPGRHLLSSAMASTLVVLSPVTPHLCEELWQRLGHAELLSGQPWPTHDPQALVQDEVTIVVQVDGKVRSKLTVPADAAAEDVQDPRPWPMRTSRSTWPAAKWPRWSLSPASC
jgi:leucyl-tRNA synthetase